MTSPGPLLSVQGLSKHFGAHAVLDAVNLNVESGTVVTVLGSSGAGKSVLLKCLAGLLKPDGGQITLAGIPLKPAAGPRAQLGQRCSYLFQGNALLDSLTALENVALPLEQTTRASEQEISVRATEALRRLGLADFRDRFPSQMSGGMQKRVALARALVTQPDLVLFDEPTAGLDPVNRNAVFEMIARYRREFGFTALLVTHDVPEALAVSDQVALLQGGRISFQGTPAEFRASADPGVEAFRDTVEHLAEHLAEIGRSIPAARPL